MNKQQSFLVVSALLFVLLNNTASFGMEKKNMRFFDFGELPILPELGPNVVNALEDPVMFGKTNKNNHFLVKKLGWHNLEEIYENQNPNFLRNHYVPILFVNINGIANNDYFGNSYGQSIPEPKEEEYKNYIASVNPYQNNFYTKPDTYVFCSEIAKIEQRRIDQYINQQKSQYPNLVVKYDKHSMNGQPLTTLLLCENNVEKIAHIVNSCEYFNGSYLNCEVNIEDFNAEKIDLILHGKLHRQYIVTILTLMSHSSHDNGILEFLLKAEKNKNKKYSFYASSINSRTNSFYSLLSYAQGVNNTKAFEALVTIDPYTVVNPMPLKNYYRNFNYDSPTILDVMIASGKFNPKNIAYFKEHGGKTTQELEATQKLEKKQNKKIVVKKEEQKCIVS